MVLLKLPYELFGTPLKLEHYTAPAMKHARLSINDDVLDRQEETGEKCRSVTTADVNSLHLGGGGV